MFEISPIFMAYIFIGKVMNYIFLNIYFMDVEVFHSNRHPCFILTFLYLSGANIYVKKVLAIQPFTEELASLLLYHIIIAKLVKFPNIYFLNTIKLNNYGFLDENI